MEVIDNTIYFESDDEFTDFCVGPYAVIKKLANGVICVSGTYSSLYLKALEEGKTFVIKDEDSVVFERGCVSKRVPVKDTGRDTLVQLDVENLEEYFDF